MTRAVVVLAFVLAAALIVRAPSLTAAAGGEGEDGTPGQKGKPLVAFGGTDSGVEARSFRRISTPEQWARLWAKHAAGDTPAGARHARVDVDFDRCTVVAAFLGRTANSEGMEVDSVIERADAVVVRFNFPGYATGAGVEPHPVTPYGFVVLPRTDKPIVLEQDEASHKAVTPTPPDWQEAARLPADGN